MENQTIRLGNIPKKVLVLFQLKGNINVIIHNETLDQIATHFPNDYLKKISECKRILGNPLYAAYDSKKKILYLVKEYIQGPIFKKVALSICLKKDAYLLDFFLLSPIKIKEIFHDNMEWKLIVAPKK